ncbi:MAG: DUF362 domain-containing protein [Puniceicoccaceae bacterium]
MKLLCHLIAMTLLPFWAFASETSFWKDTKEKSAFNGMIWRSEFEDPESSAIAAKVENLISAFEESTGKQLVPGIHRRVALKIYSNSGAGLHTPKPVVDAVQDVLKKRGYDAEDIIIVDAREEMLREAGYLPPLSEIEKTGPYYRGARIYSLNTGVQKSPTWFYESPLPMEFSSPLGREMLKPIITVDPEEARKSYLPESLVTKVDFWINLPMASHNPATGLSGALVNGTLFNVTNGTRFFSSPANASVAVAEIAAIPELNESWALNLISLEEFQYIGGPAYNANYTRSKGELWLSVDPVIMDANLIRLQNQARLESGFMELPEIPDFLVYAMQLGLGRGLSMETKFQDLP